VQLQRQLTGTAAEIDHAHLRLRLYQIEEIKKGLRSLVPKPLVLGRIPISGG